VNDAAEVAFSARVLSDAGWGSAVFRRQPGSDAALVRLDPIEPLAPNVAVWPPVIGPSGAVAWITSRAVWGPDGTGGVMSLAATGDPMAGLPAVSFGIQSNPGRLGDLLPWINAEDEVAFTADLDDSQTGLINQGLFLAHPGGPIELILKTGDVAPGSSGALFNGFAILAFGDRDEIAFTAWLIRPGDPITYEFAVYLRDADGRLRPIVMQGDSIPFPTEERTIDSFLGIQTAFDASFSRVALRSSVGEDAIHVAVIPEPSACAAAPAGIAALALRRRVRSRAAA
jgi:hypothetical protein